MCKATAIYDERLGKRRIGFCVFLHQSGEFTWFSDRQVKAKIAKGEQVNGLTVNEAGEVVMDETFTTGLLVKTGLATFTPINGEEGEGLSKYFAVTRVLKGGKGGNQYSLVSNRFKVDTVSEEHLKVLLSLASVGGAKLDAKGRVVVHPGVDVVEPAKATEPNKGDDKG